MDSFAIIKTGGKQYKVKEGDKILIEKLEAQEGADVSFDEVLLVSNGALSIGQPFVDGAKVTGKVLEQGRAKKKIVFRYKAKVRRKKKKGHRQPFTKVEITKISAK